MPPDNHDNEDLGERLTRLERENQLLRQRLEAREAQAPPSDGQDKYRRMVDTANEGVWAVDAQWRTTFVNGKMADMLGLAPADMQGRPLADFVVAQDQPEHQRQAELRQAGQASRYELRLRRADGGALWTMVSATPLMDNGVFAGSFAMYADISQRKTMDDTLAFLAQGASATPELGFFRALALHLAQRLEMDLVCIDRLEADGRTARTVALWRDGEFLDNLTYALEGTPCGAAAGQTVCCFPAGVAGLFPDDAALGEMAAESYLAVTLWGHAGAPIGLIAVVGRRPLTDPSLAEAVLKMVAMRAAAEMERLEAENALRQSEERFRRMFDEAPLAYQSLDADGLFLDVNQAWLRTLGYGREQVIGQWFGRFLRPESLSHFEKNFPCFKDAGQISGVEFEMARADGAPVNVAFDGVTALGPDGSFRQTHCIFQDITQRKREEEARRKSEAELAAIYDGAPVIMILVDQDRRVIKANRAALETSGRDLSQAVGLRGGEMLKCMHAFDDPRGCGFGVDCQRCVVRNTVIETLRTGRPSHRVEADLWLDLGQGPAQVFVLVSANLLMVDDQRRVLLCIEDVTERKQAEVALRHSEEKFRLAFLTSPDAINIYRLSDGRCLEVNDGFLALTGYARDEVIGRSSLEIDIWDDPADRRRMMEGLRANGRVSNLEARFRFKDGRVRVGLLSAVIVTLDGEPCILSITRDIDHIKQAEEALRQSEEKFRQAFQTSPDAFNITRVSDGAYLDVNDGFVALTGYSRQEAIGHSALELNIWRDQADRQRLLDGLRLHGRVSNLEARFGAKDGRTFVGLISAVLIVFDGEPCILAITRDIDHLKRAEQALRESERTLSTLMANLPGMAYRCHNDEQWTMEFISQGCLALTGYQAAELLDNTAVSYAGLIVPEDRDMIWYKVQSALQRREPFQFTYRIKTAQGQVRWVWEQGCGVFDDDGSLLALEGFIADMDERKKAEAALKDNERRLSAIMEATPDPMVVYNEQGQATFINPAFTRTFGWKPEELLGKQIPFVPDDQKEAVANTIKGLLASGGQVSLETKRLTKDGRVLDIVISAARVLDEADHVTGMVVNLTDVTRTKRLEAQLRQAQKMEAIGTLAGGIAHDFNNILGAVLGYAELAQELAQNNEPNLYELGQVQKAAERARNLVKQILTFSRKAEADLRPLSLNKIIGQTVQMLERTLPKMIDIETHLAGDLRAISADGNQMEQVLLNLATNAADAMPDGGRLLVETKNVRLNEEYSRLLVETKNVRLNEEYSRLHLEVKAGDYVLLQVSDTGQGMDERTREQIFDPFFTTKAVGKGTGLGLATVYGIVRGHGGHVYCYSEPGMGATFKIYLPVHQMPDEAPSIGQELSEHLFRGVESILLVDDEEALRDLGARALRAMGYKVTTAQNGEEALELFKAMGHDIDLVVMDLGMPGMGGHKCLKEMLTIDPEARVVIASGYSANGQVRDSLAAGALGFVPKPFGRLDLLSTVRQALDKKIDRKP